MTKREKERLTRQSETLQSLGFTADEADKLRRISMTLRRWHELECGTGDGQVLRSVERDGDEPDSKPYLRIKYPTSTGYVDKRYPIADRETGARRRLAKIMQAHHDRQTPIWTDGKAVYPNVLKTYIQTDPRGAALYILRPGDVPEGETEEGYYSRGICVY